MTPLDYRDVPIFLISFNNRDRGLSQLVDWLLSAGQRSITLLDNNSTWPPTVDYLDSITNLSGGLVTVHRYSKNHGFLLPWVMDVHLQATGPFIISDPDVVPDPQCPLDLVRKMLEVEQRHHPAKVGPALRIDDLPDCFAQRDHMRVCEMDYWTRRYPEGDCWDAALDTTFSLFQPSWERWPLADQGGVAHIRLDFPYVMQHKPWYEDSSNLSAEARYYMAHVAVGVSSSCLVPIPEEAAR